MKRLISNKNQSTRAYRFFNQVIEHGRFIILGALVACLGMAAFIPNIRIDTSVEAFIGERHPSLVSRNQVKEIFGLSDPIILAIENRGPKGIYEQKTLQLIQDLSDTIQKIPGVDPERVVSLATENSIRGDENGIVIESFLEDKSDAALVRAAVENFPLYVGNLVSEDGTVSILVIELLDKQKYGAAVYADLVALTTALDRKENLFIAGEGAVVEHLGKYVQDDAKLMTPLAFLVITLVLFLAYRTLGGLLLSNMVIMGSLLIAMGTMVALDVPFYLISNIIPVIIIAISVADSIHILGHYYELSSKNPGAKQREMVLQTMTEMWRPILITSVTNVVGFIAMGYSSTMPPMRAVGLYSSLGVIAALVFSLFVLPAVMTRVRIKGSKAFSGHQVNHVDGFGRLMLKLGNKVLKNPRLTIAIAAVICLLGFAGMVRMELNDTMVEYFNPKEDIYQADKLLNEKLNGTNFFDVMVETDGPEGLFILDRLKKIEAFQRFIEKQPHVKGTTSIVDIMKQMNRSISHGVEEEYRLPESDALIAQYFLLYSASSSPTDFEQYVDHEYQSANIRVMMDNGQYKYIAPVLEETRLYLKHQFTDEGISGEVSGWLNVMDQWIGSISLSHYLGVFLAMVIVLLISALSFKSIYAGLLAMIPVAVAVFLNYAIMGFTGIWLKVSTSITVAIAIGVAVDFSVHTIDRLIVLTREKGLSINEALPQLYPNTGRALFFNLLALALGFGTNMVSAVPPWATFGLLVMTMVTVSFIASLTLLPVLIKILKPKFLEPNRSKVIGEVLQREKAA